MTDVFSPAKRSWVMSRVRGKDTKPERLVRSFLHKRGFRFTLHRRDLPGRPDIVLPRFRTVVFVHGCFWHGHRGCSRATIPTTHRSFWRKKIESNMRRDDVVLKTLKQEGWRVLTVWQCQAQ